MELERQLSVLLAAQAERDQLIARQTIELAKKSALLEETEANATEEKRRRSELREHEDRLAQTSMVKQRDAELVDMQSKLTRTEAKLEAKEFELEAVRLRLKDAENGLAKSKAEADTLRAQTATSSVNREVDEVTRRLMERVRAIEAEVASRRWNEKSIEEMECRNEG